MVWHVNRPSPKLLSFRTRNAPAQVSPADVDVDSEAKPAWATRNTQAALWYLLEPQLQLGLSHLLVSKVSRAQDVLRTAGGQRVGQERRQRRGGARYPWAGEGGCWAGGPSCPPSAAGAGGPGLSCQHAQHQLSLPRPPPSSPLSANPQGRHSPSALQMRNWPTVPANTGDGWRRRRAGSTGLPRVLQYPAAGSASSTRGRARCQLASGGPSPLGRQFWSISGPSSRQRCRRARASSWPQTGPLPSERLLTGKGSPASHVTMGCVRGCHGH